MRWIWLRHGETDGNAQRRYVGHTDDALNGKGWCQAHLASRELSDLRIDGVYSSDLGRCMETAKVVAAVHGMNPVYSSALRELNFGLWEGKTYEEIQGLDPEHLARWAANPWEIAPPGGETLLQMGARFDRWLEEVWKRMNPDGTYLFVSHGGPIRWFQCKWVENDPRRFWEVKGLSHGDWLVAEWDGQKWTINRELERRIRMGNDDNGLSSW